MSEAAFFIQLPDFFYINLLLCGKRGSKRTGIITPPNPSAIFEDV
jgi:hypothetical protein